MKRTVLVASLAFILIAVLLLGSRDSADSEIAIASDLVYGKGSDSGTEARSGDAEERETAHFLRSFSFMARAGGQVIASR